jgi:peptidyl-tRNA hydrolase, PTH1 family
MKLIVGLGNPGSKYDGTRHNIGFLALDSIARDLDAHWQEKSKFKALVAETQFGSEKALLMKPTTYYNLAGEAVRAAVDFYKLLTDTDVLVIHDELDLPFGTLRTRLGGSDAGNNGVKNIISHIDPAFARIRIGVANDQLAHQDATDFVLGKFTAEEKAQLPEIFDHAQQFTLDFVHREREFSPTSHKIA